MEQHNLVEKIKRDSKIVLLLLVIFIIIFKIIFYQESIMVIIRAVVAFFLTFTIPGFILTYLWHDKLDFVERFIVGNMIGLISVGILSYNLSSLYVHIKILSIIVPIVVAIIFTLLVYVSEKKKITPLQSNKKYIK